MDGATLQQKVYAGYAKAALRIGTSFNQYRASTAINPTASGNLVQSLLASANVNWAYDRANKYGNAVYQMLVDGTQTQVGDFLVGSSTYYIAAMQPLLPILAVKCNHTITIKRPTQPVGVGQVGYGGYQDSTATILYQGCPASILEGTKGENNSFNLPNDIKMPWWRVIFPSLGGVNIVTGDIITDETNLQYQVSSAELTELGWRLTAGQVGA